MALFILIVTCLVCNAVAIKQPFVCPSNYTLSYTDYTCFKVYLEQRETWEGAMAVCRAEGNGTLLQMKHTSKQNDVAGHLMNGNRYWVGLQQDTSDNGLFKNLDRTPLPGGAVWDWREPNNYGGDERCLEVIDDGKASLNDKWCTKKRPFVCQIDALRQNNNNMPNEIVETEPLGRKGQGDQPMEFHRQQEKGSTPLKGESDGNVVKRPKGEKGQGGESREKGSNPLKGESDGNVVKRSKGEKGQGGESMEKGSNPLKGESDGNVVKRPKGEKGQGGESMEKGSNPLKGESDENVVKRPKGKKGLGDQPMEFHRQQEKGSTPLKGESDGNVVKRPKGEKGQGGESREKGSTPLKGESDRNVVKRPKGEKGLGDQPMEFHRQQEKGSHTPKKKHKKTKRSPKKKQKKTKRSPKKKQKKTKRSPKKKQKKTKRSPKKKQKKRM